MEKLQPIPFSFELFTQIIAPLVKNGTTDIHIAPGEAPFIRKAKSLMKLRLPVKNKETGQTDVRQIQPMLPDDTKKFVTDLLFFNHRNSETPEIAQAKVEAMLNKVENREECDTSLSLRGISRFRVHIGLQRSSFTCSLRVVSDKIPKLAGFPAEVRNFVQFHNGLVIVSGKTSSGKSTTLASLIQEMNETESRRIITLEDPIEYLYHHQMCQIVQREIGIDTKDYKTGMISALREDPDVLVIGEMRDVESFEIALNAAESGTLVFTTMHSGSAKEALERIVSMFPDDKQNQVKSQLATVLKGIICQQLIPCCKKEFDSPLVAAFEIMTSNQNAAVASAIRQGKFADIPNLIETNRKSNMRTMKDSLQKLKEGGLISDEEWFSRSSILA